MRRKHLIAALTLLLIGVAVGVAMYITSADRLKAFEEGGKWGFKNSMTGVVEIEARYDDCREFSEGIAAVAVGDKWGYIDAKGKYVAEPSFEEAQGHLDGLATVKSNGKYGFVDLQGHVAIKPSFDDAGWFSGGLAPVQRGAKWGYIDKAGEFVLQPQFDGALPFRGEYAVFLRNVKGNVRGMRGVIDRKGQMVIQPVYDDIVVRPDGFTVELNGKYATLDREGNLTSDWKRRKK